MSGFQPTAEQVHALDLFGTGNSLAIEAGAGTGKTSTLVVIAESTDWRGQYVAFNKAIVEESKQKMPGHVNCNTAHSLAFRAVGKNFKHRLNSGRMRSTDLAKRLGLSNFQLVTQDGQQKELSASFLAGVVMNTVTRFCQSADLEPDALRHARYIDGIDIPPVEDGKRNYQNNDAVRRFIQPAVVRAWADLQDTRGTLPYRHDHYLKQWQLDDPRIPADFILFDEAQDANPVMVAIVAAQTEAQLVWVGDSQQQIYSFTGALNALASVPADQRAYLTQSFRFGPAIAEVANELLEALDAELRLTGTDSIDSSVGTVDEPAAVLTRTNAEAVRAVLAGKTAGKRPHLVGGGREFAAFAKAADVLMRYGRTDHPELACFDSWGEVQTYVQQDEQGAELRLNVRLIDEFGVDTIIATLERMPREDNADLIVSTAHKSKGRELASVQLGGDFPAEPEGEELRLLYVGCTRAQLRLDNTGAGFFTREGLHDAGAVEVPPAGWTCAAGHGPYESSRAARACTACAPAAPAPGQTPTPGAAAPQRGSQGRLRAAGRAAPAAANGAAGLPVYVPAGNPAHGPLTTLAAYLDGSREKGEAHLRHIDRERQQHRDALDRIERERLLLVALLDPEKQAHYEED